ncbi:MAG: hypothetical protein JW896_09895 [Deltaproteobacteria bacterium]|nr:hypothetical protein [Deltaproteobacteria bacterium]
MNISHDLKSSSLTASVMLFMVMCAPCRAMAEQPLTIDASRCVHIKSALERLTCYDELADQAQQTHSDRAAADLSDPESDSDSEAPVTIIQQESAAAAVTQGQAEVEKAPVTEHIVSEAGRVTEENFGFPPEKRDDGKGLVELHSTIKGLKEIRPFCYLITLENGQIWRQMVAERYRLKVGHNVRIYPTRWSKKDFRLSAEGLKGTIQVQRER